MTGRFRRSEQSMGPEDTAASARLPWNGRHWRGVQGDTVVWLSRQMARPLLLPAWLVSMRFFPLWCACWFFVSDQHGINPRLFCLTRSTFVCPTEIIAYSDKMDEFKKIGCEVVGASIDSHYSHFAWINMPRKVGCMTFLSISVDI